jgi:hypothetical protein
LLDEKYDEFIFLLIKSNNCNMLTWFMHNIVTDPDEIRQTLVDDEYIETIISDDNLEMVKCLSYVNLLDFSYSIYYAVRSINFRITKFLLDYSRYKFTEDDNIEISDSLDQAYNMLLEPENIVIVTFENEYDEFVDIIWYLLQYRFIYQGEEQEILHIIREVSRKTFSLRCCST